MDYKITITRLSVLKRGGKLELLIEVRNMPFLIFIVVVAWFSLYYYGYINDFRKNKGRYFNVPYKNIEISATGILINNKLLQIGNDKNIHITVKVLPHIIAYRTQNNYIFYVSSIYSSVKFINLIPLSEYKTLENKLVDFFTKNGFSVSVSHKPVLAFLKDFYF
jgi:hypothetical protein